MLNSIDIREVYYNSLKTDTTQLPNEIKVIGIGCESHIFDKLKLEENKELVEYWFTQFEDPFYSDTGGGWSVDNLKEDNKNKIWTDLDDDIEKLVALGLAINVIKYVWEDKNKWKRLPNGKPYIVIKRI